MILNVTWSIPNERNLLFKKTLNRMFENAALIITHIRYVSLNHFLIMVGLLEFPYRMLRGAATAGHTSAGVGLFAAKRCTIQKQSSGKGTLRQLKVVIASAFRLAMNTGTSRMVNLPRTASTRQ